MKVQDTYIAPRNLHMAKPARKSCLLGKNIAVPFESRQLTHFLFVLTRDRNATKLIVPLRSLNHVWASDRS